MWPNPQFPEETKEIFNKKKFIFCAVKIWKKILEHWRSVAQQDENKVGIKDSIKNTKRMH